MPRQGKGGPARMSERTAGAFGNLVDSEGFRQGVGAFAASADHERQGSKFKEGQRPDRFWGQGRELEEIDDLLWPRAESAAVNKVRADRAKQRGLDDPTVSEQYGKLLGNLDDIMPFEERHLLMSCCLKHGTPIFRAV